MSVGFVSVGYIQISFWNAKKNYSVNESNLFLILAFENY